MPGLPDGDSIALIYTGNRWFLVWFSLADLNWTWESQLISIGESHGKFGVLLFCFKVGSFLFRDECHAAKRKLPALTLNIYQSAFWGRDYDPLFTKYVSDETKKDTPVGVDFYWIGTGERSDQFGPFGALYPLQLHNQTGRGYFRCGGPISSLGNLSASDRKLQLQSLQMNKRLFKL